MCGAEKVDRGGDEGLSKDKKESKAQRSALLKTEGGIMGEELEGEDIKKRRTTFGN